ncbi:MAG: type II secretion system protein [Proteobacteria bacterium]|nr:type II secretion system protein [Pseudomonadota bacterium]
MQTPFLKEHREQKTIRGFTLIELLVVIAIIAILAGLLMPAASSAQNSAKKTTAKNQTIQLVTAITSYETEYGRLPSFSGTNLSSSNLGMLLSGDSNNNPRGLNFIEVAAWKPGKGGTNGSGFCDPFASNNVYSVSLDTNYSNVQPNVELGGGFGTTNLTRHIMVWSTPKVGKTNVLINSWD